MRNAPLSPSRGSFQALLARAGIPLSADQVDQLWGFHGLLRAANAQLNLTRIHNFENMVLKHYVDSLLVLRFEALPSPLLDVGSGAGLPGIPLKVARPETELILAEPRAARAQFLREACEHLALEGVEVYPHKIGPGFARPVAGAILRALASIPAALDLLAGCLPPGGRALLMKGPRCDAEIEQAAQEHASVFRLAADHAYTIPGTTHQRRLVVYERLEGEPRRADRNFTAVAAGGFDTGRLREVTSESNPAYRQALELLSGRGIRKHGQALLAGQRIVNEVIAQAPDHVAAWVTGPEGPPPPDALGESVAWLRLARPLFRALDTVGTHAPLVQVRVPELAEWTDDATWPEGCTLFVPFQDPENVGAVIRSAAAFSVSRIVLLREAAHPFHPRSARAAGPALFQVPMQLGPSLATLDCRNAPLIALAREGAPVGAQTFPERFGLVAGLEGPGLPAHLRAGERRSIPMPGQAESLNAATAVAIALYEWRSQRADVGGSH